MPKKKKSYPDTKENEYIFNVLKKFPADLLHTLTRFEQAIVADDELLIEYLEHATIDQKNIFLAKAGVQFAQMYIDTKDEEAVKMLLEPIDQNTDRQALIKKMIDKKIFVTTGREIIGNVYLLAQNSHSLYYYVNIDYLRASKAIEIIAKSQAGKRAKTADEKKIIDGTDQARETMASLVYEVLESDNFIRAHLKMKSHHFRLLLYLFHFRTTYVTVAAIFKNFAQYAFQTNSKIVQDLHRAGYIVAYPGTERIQPMTKRSYTLGELGMITVCSALEKYAHKAMKL